MQRQQELQRQQQEQQLLAQQAAIQAQQVSVIFELFFPFSWLWLYDYCTFENKPKKKRRHHLSFL